MLPLLFFSNSSPAQRFSEDLLNPLPTLTTEVQEVSLVLTVTNPRGRFVRDLTAADLSILDNDHAPERITYFQRETDLPLRVALVVDTSESVTYRFRFEQKAAAAFLGHILRPQMDRALVIGFNQEIHVTRKPTGDPDVLARSISSLRLPGDVGIGHGHANLSLGWW